MTVILAVDQGTSGTKALVHDGERTLSVVEVPVRPAYLDGGRVEVDPLELLQSVRQAGIRALREAGDPPLAAVSLANQGESVLAWDPSTGRPLSTVLVWQDGRAQDVCAGMGEHTELIRRRTGLVLDPYFSAPKMAWLRRHATREGVVTTTDSWLVHQLTGEFVTDATTASRSLLLDLDEVAWDPELLALFGLDDEALPRVARCDEVVGGTSMFGASGSGAEVPVAGLVVDQQAALVAERCLDPGMVKCTYGTGAFLLGATGDRAVRSAHGLTSSLAWSLRASTGYCLDGQVYTAGSAVRWLVDLGLLSAPDALDAEAAGDSGGACFVPGLAGLAQPWRNPEPCGAFTGLGLATTRGRLVRAVVEGLAAQVATLARAMSADIGVPVTRLRVDGGLTRSHTLMQAQADLLQVPVDVYPSPHATALGTAALARLALDDELSLPAAIDGWSPAVSFEPAWTERRAAEAMARWEKAARSAAARRDDT
ncbi:carbohydrate kinase [Sphaerisporangium krabiense]|uniref:ATP:glycerol 3-phosphotransferase n=1 Tax=Sphaerisporangium krabiense TaxID=763782 RepID=A0A7W8Z3M7_9ACTN|nr:FGGY family carbohydrate kinase [Sphaerisporangium krabiense]MBB5626868.1 glycerol kinase [Sphaerisporangium krabiense]GII66667.1 carbohydrate kinase [Sphaerisporangium krabiense]